MVGEFGDPSHDTGFGMQVEDEQRPRKVIGKGKNLTREEQERMVDYIQTTAIAALVGFVGFGLGAMFGNVLGDRKGFERGYEEGRQSAYNLNKVAQAQSSRAVDEGRSLEGIYGEADVASNLRYAKEIISEGGQDAEN